MGEKRRGIKMGYIETYFKKAPHEINTNDLESFIRSGIEENLHLDYKDIRILDSDKGINDLSMHVSAFANSDGGLIVVGIKENYITESGCTVKILPDQITWGDPSLVKEDLERKLSSKMSPCPVFFIHPVRKNKENGDLSVIFLIDVPQSENPPHQAFDSRYYKRYNFEKRPMDHYELSDLFGKRRKPKLQISIEPLKYTELENAFDIEIAFILVNIGNAIAKYTLVMVHFPENSKIFKCVSGFQDVAGVNNNNPIAQFNYEKGVIHPKLPFRIGSIIIRVPKTYKGVGGIGLYADNMETINQEFEINLRGNLREIKLKD